MGGTQAHIRKWLAYRAKLELIYCVQVYSDSLLAALHVPCVVALVC
jgi:hypothetical protein